MQVLRGLDDLATHLRSCGDQPKCFADTGFLYALAYDDDRLFQQANDVLDLLSECSASLYANVISRMEFVDLIFRKQVTQGCIQLFGSLGREAHSDPIYALLKDIRDKDTAARRQNQSYKIDEHRLKKLRKNVEQVYGIADWKDFCEKYVGALLVNEWSILEEELGLNFVEVMEGGVSDLLHSPLRWTDMVRLMGEQGLRGPDAMIANLFAKSRFPLLITSDSDFESCLSASLSGAEKAIFILR